MTTMTKVLKFYSHRDWGGYDSVTKLLSKYGMDPVNHPDAADIIIFNGGEDIATDIYSEKTISDYIPQHPSQRDRVECELFDSYKDRPDKLILGICRGAQLLNCLNGGKLYQDVNNHTRSHDLFDLRTGKTFKATSTHHQQMIAGTAGKVIAVASESSVKYNAAGKHIYQPNPEAPGEGDDMEIMWYPAHRTLCIQGHPEYVVGQPFADYCVGLINEFYQESVRSVA